MMSPRKGTIDDQYKEDGMSDSAAEDWETVSQSYGRKVTFKVGTVLTGEYLGVRDVPQDDDSDEGFSIIQAGEVHESSTGEKVYFWLPFAFKQAFIGDEKNPASVTVGDMVRIECVGEQETSRGLNPVKLFTVQRKTKK
jgi:hypothetical protein